MIKVIAADFETTGTDAKNCAVIESSFLFIEDGEISEKLTLLMRPFDNALIMPEALELTKTTIQTIYQYPDPKEAFAVIVNRLDSFIDRFDKNDKAFFMAYRAGFDLEFLTNMFIRNGNDYLGSYLNWKVLDPLLIVHLLQYLGKIPDLKNCKLQTLCEYFNIKIDSHRAESDILATWQLYNKLLPLLCSTQQPVIETMRRLKNDLRYVGAPYTQQLVNIAWNLQKSHNPNTQYEPPAIRHDNFLDSMAAKYKI